jgi:abequosyltransferase
MAPAVSICIPSYNRPVELGDLLASIALEPPGGWEIVISEDHAPRGCEVRSVVDEFRVAHGEIPVAYFSNEHNLGFDGNLRALVARASGDYCLFMGDDDLLCPGALATLQAAVVHENVGVVLRSWKSVDKATGDLIELHRYYPGDCLFQSGRSAIISFFRKSVFISGLLIHRESALRYATDRFDGTLLYQLWLVGRILAEKNGFYIADTLAVRRVGGDHFFGSADAEKGRFEPKTTTPQHSLTFIAGLLRIADALGAEVGAGAQEIRSELAAYSFPLLSMHAHHLSRREFRAYADALARLGLGKSRLFWIYYCILSTLGTNLSERGVRFLKRILGSTPVLVHH